MKHQFPTHMQTFVRLVDENKFNSWSDGKILDDYIVTTSSVCINITVIFIINKNAVWYCSKCPHQNCWKTIEAKIHSFLGKAQMLHIYNSVLVPHKVPSTQDIVSYCHNMLKHVLEVEKVANLQDQYDAHQQNKSAQIGNILDFIFTSQDNVDHRAVGVKYKDAFNSLGFLTLAGVELSPDFDVDDCMYDPNGVLKISDAQKLKLKDNGGLGKFNYTDMSRLFCREYTISWDKNFSLFDGIVSKLNECSVHKVAVDGCTALNFTSMIKSLQDCEKDFKAIKNKVATAKIKIDEIPMDLYYSRWICNFLRGKSTTSIPIDVNLQEFENIVGVGMSGLEKHGILLCSSCISREQCEQDLTSYIENVKQSALECGDLTQKDSHHIFTHFGGRTKTGLLVQLGYKIIDALKLSEQHPHMMEMGIWFGKNRLTDDSQISNNLKIAQDTSLILLSVSNNNNSISLNVKSEDLWVSPTLEPGDVLCVRNPAEIDYNSNYCSYYRQLDNCIFWQFSGKLKYNSNNITQSMGHVINDNGAIARNVDILTYLVDMLNSRVDTTVNVNWVDIPRMGAKSLMQGLLSHCVGVVCVPVANSANVSENLLRILAKLFEDCKWFCYTKMSPKDDIKPECKHSVTLIMLNKQCDYNFPMFPGFILSCQNQWVDPTKECVYVAFWSGLNVNCDSVAKESVWYYYSLDNQC